MIKVTLLFPGLCATENTMGENVTHQNYEGTFEINKTGHNNFEKLGKFLKSMGIEDKQCEQCKKYYDKNLYDDVTGNQHERLRTLINEKKVKKSINRWCRECQKIYIEASVTEAEKRAGIFR